MTRLLLVVAALALVAMASAQNISFIYSVSETNALYIGNQFAAQNFTLLKSLNISAILNVAWDLDLIYPMVDYENTNLPSNENLILQYHKVGLVDGTGNTNFSMAAAVYQLDQLFTPRVLEIKDLNTFPNPVQNVLLHCHSGLSRSVTVGSLYLYYVADGKFPNFTDALTYVQTQRNSTRILPAAPLIALAQQLSAVNILNFF
eukprot:c7993_g1_i1.p1 GENE.c7993_g1_i1~~c7993_g1_i1.p1  ORF type:complete len:203 (+),score=44.95 c7993_g1_i1:118-726(+)